MRESKPKRTAGRANRWAVLTCTGAALVFAAVALAQDYRTFQGSNTRTGRPTVQPATVAPETTWNNIGRGFLRWFDPIFNTGNETDNDIPLLTSANPAANWINPAPVLVNPNIILAGGFYQPIAASAPYRVAVTSTAASTVTNPNPGGVPIYEWTINGLVDGEEYEVQASVPVGETNIQPDGNFPADRRFPARYHLFEVEDATGIRRYILDLDIDGGGFSPLGGELERFTANGVGEITVRVYATVVRNEFGTPLEPTDIPGSSVTYADAVRAVGRTVLNGSYRSTPVVGELVNTPFQGGATVFPQRVVSARNESVVLSTTGRTINFGSVTSFTHNGAIVAAAQPLRRNMVWSWPAARPNNLLQTELERYAADREAWINGGPANTPRSQVFRRFDNLSPGVTVAGAFTSQAAFNRIGPDYYETPATGAPNASVTWTAEGLPEGNYRMQVYVPTDDPAATYARGATYQVFQGATLVDTLMLDQSANNGWTLLPGQLTDGYEHTALNPLTLRVLNSTSVATDVTEGRNVIADAMRFVADADLAIDSTPVMVSANVRVGAVTAPRDVVVVARENGRLYAMDAHGDETTGLQPAVFWTWPAEDPSTDPDNDPLEDYGIATHPFQFDLSSAAVANVGGDDLLFIGTTDGRVHCLEMEGRGDGTTRRRWTYPDDFNPTSPLTPLAVSPLGPISGSVSVTNIGGNPAVIIPDSNGRVIAVDAAGDPATKTTNVIWAYPAAPVPLGELLMTPTVVDGRVIFGSKDAADPAEGTIYAVDLTTGALDWSRDVRADNTTRFGGFSSSSPAYLEAALNPLGVNAVYFVDNGGYITALNTANGDVLWEDNSIPNGADGSLAITHLRITRPPAIILDAVPTVMVPTRGGALIGFNADGTLNAQGNAQNYRYFFEGNQQVGSIAMGGWPNALGPLANRSHMYVGDSLGFLYAFSSEDDDNTSPPITPGLPPGSSSGNPGDPGQGVLDDMILDDEVVLVSPETYRELLNLSQSTTGLDYASVQDAVDGRIQRRDFEMGETLYILIYDIYSQSITETAGYSVEVEVEPIGGGSRPRNAITRDVTGAPDATVGGIALIQVPLQPTGPVSITPGIATVEVRARLNRGRGAERRLRASTNRTATTNPNQIAPGNPRADISIANPLALDFLNPGGTPILQVANTLNPAAPEVTGNGPTGNYGAQPKNRRVDGFAGNAVVPGWRLATSPAADDQVAHGGSALAYMNITDRSLMILLNGGSRGINNVRWHARDMSWQPGTDPSTWAQDNADPALPFTVDPATDLAVYRALNAGTNKANWLYRSFEDYPWRYPNTSIDYPDVKRSTLNVSKEVFGDSQNPLFSGVQLTGPAYTPADLATYETTAGYELGLNRGLVPTRFDVNWEVPVYQPLAIFGYVGRQSVYVDNGQPGFQNDDAYRDFSLGAIVGEDLRMLTGTPTVDLGSTPAGGGFNGGVPGDPLTTVPFDGPLAPWNAASRFRPWNPEYNQWNPTLPSIYNTPNLINGRNVQFQQFTVLNNGNANLLNVRASKSISKLVGATTNVERPLELYAPDQHELAWIDGASNLFSDLDPALSPTFRAGVDPDGRIPLQKARVGDPGPTTMSTNPSHRVNANLRVGEGNLLDRTAFPVGAPYFGIAPPIGTPVGSYSRRVWAFEDEGNNTSPAVPSLGQTTRTDGSSIWVEPETYTDPGILLKFNVRETALTNQPTAKSAYMVDVTDRNQGFNTSNRQPTAVRDSAGNVFTAWSSNRLSVATVDGDPNLSTGNNPWRILVAGLNRPTGVFLGQSPLNDLNGFNAFDANRWFNPTQTIPANPLTAFQVAAGETLDTSRGDASFAFVYPAFPTHGLTNPFAANRYDTSTFDETFLTFVGEATKRDSSGATTRHNQLMTATLSMNANGTVDVNGIFAMPFDTSSVKLRPTTFVVGNTLHVYYVGQTSGVSQLFHTTFTNGVWTAPISMGVADGFEDLGHPSVVARNSLGYNTQVADVFFTGKVRGRSNSETFMGQVELSLGGIPGVNGGQWRHFINRSDRLEFDAASGTFWAPGVDWRLTDTDLNDFELAVRRFDPGSGTYIFQSLQEAGTQLNVNRETREISYPTTLGGDVFIDGKRGSVKFSGAMLPRNADLYLTYAPKFVRVSGTTSATYVDDGTGGRIVNSTRSTGANYRHASAFYDPRLLGVHIQSDPDRQDQNRVEDLNYWFDSNNLRVPGGALISHDRFWLATGRTSGDGGGPSRPYMSSFRFGIQLPTAVATTADGSLVGLTVDFSGTGGLSGPAYYQVDPVNGRVYFSAPLEGRQVSIQYVGADANGNNLGALNVPPTTVSVVPEKGEYAMPIEQVGNESDVWLTIDPIWATSTLGRRPPLVWSFWTSSRSGAPGVFYQTMAPKTAPQVPRR